MDREHLEKKIADVASKLDSPLDTPAEEVLDDGLALFDEVNTYLNQAVYDVNSESKPATNIVVLGTTGTGKSTVVSFLFGEGKMLVHHETQFSRVLKAEQPLPGVAIRSGSSSSTLLPICNHICLGKDVIAVWDMPGSRDTRGPFVELLVHFILKWMLVDDKTLRFIIVSPPLHERPQVVALQNTINGSLIEADNAVLVYTKCSTDFDPDSTADLEIKENKRGIKSFALPAPKTTDPDGHDYTLQYRGVKHKIVDTLAGLRSDSVEFNEPLPDAAQRLLDSFRESSIAFAGEKLSTRFLALYDWNAYRGTLVDFRKTLKALQTIDKLSLQAVLDLLARLLPTTRDQLQSDPATANASRRLTHVEILMNSTIQCRLGEWLSAECFAAVEKAKSKMSLMIRDVKAHLRNSTCYHGQGKVLLLCGYNLHVSQYQDQICSFIAQCTRHISSAEAIPTVVLVGFASLTIDVSPARWANFALVSPVVRVMTNDPFVLSAVGRRGCFPTDFYRAGYDGRDGMPGLSGGNLRVVCNKLDDKNEVLRATISCGQVGGDGEKGCDGVNGADSTYRLADFERAVDGVINDGLLAEEEDVMTKVRTNDLFVASCNDHLSPLSGRFYGTQGVKKMVVAKESVPGGEGKPPGNGGNGGNGGLGGAIYLQVDREVWQSVGKTGGEGPSGAAGNPARNGRSSPEFSVLIRQWYFKGGWYNGMASQPEAKFSSEVAATPSLMYPSPPSESARQSSGDRPVPNSSLSLMFVKEMYDMLRKDLESKFRQCDFSDLRIEWVPVSAASSSGVQEA